MKEVAYPKPLLDTARSDRLASRHSVFDKRRAFRQGAKDKASRKKGLVINPDAWAEWLAVAHHVYHDNPEAEIYDVFEWLRVYDLGQSLNGAKRINQRGRDIP